MERSKMPREFQQFWFTQRELEGEPQEIKIKQEGITKEWNDFLLAVQARVEKDFPEIE
ncbi:MAG: hypothetical protein LRY71_09200 [Bacillaceae bacterium]|nr:hypothetical protein [Bacillaceae bacterium]